MSLNTYINDLDAAALRAPSGAARWPQDKDAANAVLCLAAEWVATGALNPGLLAMCKEHMPAHEAVSLAQTLGGIALRGSAMGRVS